MSVHWPGVLMGHWQALAELPEVKSAGTQNSTASRLTLICSTTSLLAVSW